jgi:integrase
MIPKKELELKKTSDVPTEFDLELLEKIAETGIVATGIGSAKKRNGAKKALLAIRIIKETGLRVGALGNLKIDELGNFVTVSKGRRIHGKLSLKILDLIQYLNFDENQPLLKYKRNTFSMWLLRMSKKVKIKSFGPHSIRHWYAVQFYNKHKDLVALQKALGHKSVGSTQSYLATLVNQMDD